MKKFMVSAGSLAAMALFGSAQAVADQSGFAGMHAQNVVKGRLCFSGHTHVGSSGSAHSKRAAMAAAAGDWSSFTAFEYGSSWARWKIATAKSASCEKSSGNWICEVQAMPCLNGKRRSRRHAKR